MRSFALAVATALLMPVALAPAALAHGGGSPDYQSEVRSVSPEGSGLRVAVRDGDDRLELRNTGGRTVVVEGYEGEPYARLSPDGAVEVNRRSPALYLNEDRFADVDLPAGADGDAAPDWELRDRSGRFEWHDHRIHWMARERPAKVVDPERRTRIFDWKVPLRVDGRAGAVTGELDWVGRPSQSFPVAAGALLGAIVVAALVLAVVVRRRRRSRGDRRSDDRPEAW